jgi:DNA-binding NtrC family response regulator
MARAVHGSSDRAGRPFVAVNCGAIPEALVESILFGHEKGSFTGATDRHAGKFQEANGGTLLLDEVGELPLDVQVKLLRVLQEGEVDPVGARRSVKVDVRIISATNRDLARAVAEGVFREDLFYRLNVFPIEAPPLRERRQDIPVLVEAFIRRFSIEEGRAIAGASAETLDLLVNYDWPGNIRQLENAVYRAIVLADSPQLQPYDFPAISGLSPPAPAAAAPSPPPAHLPPAAVPAGTASAASAPVSLLDEEGHLRTLEAIEADLIRLAIERYQGHMSEVARRLGIGRSTLYRKVRENGLGDLVGLGDP